MYTHIHDESARKRADAPTCDDVTCQALKSVYEREDAPAGDVLRRIHELTDKFELKNDKATESERKLTQVRSWP